MNWTIISLSHYPLCYISFKTKLIIDILLRTCIFQDLLPKIHKLLNNAPALHFLGNAGGTQTNKLVIHAHKVRRLKVIPYSVLIEPKLLLRFQYLTALLLVPQMPNLRFPPLMFDLGYDYIPVRISCNVKPFA